MARSAEHEGASMDMPPPEGATREEFFALREHDVLDFWGKGSFVITSVLVCREKSANRTYEWRWIFLDDGTLVEVSPDGYYHYTEHRVLKQGTGPYEEIVAQDGALVRFEEHLRAGASGRRPVHVTIGDRPFRLTSTGTVSVVRVGPEPDLIPWSSFSANEEDNVYFGLEEDEVEGSYGLGLWTAHVCVSLGTEFDPTDVTIYPADHKHR